MLSHIIYILCFGASVGCTWLASQRYVYGRIKDVRIVNLIFSAIAVFLPCFLAAVRDSSIGYDVQLYGDSVFSGALRYSNFFAFLESRNFEKLFMALGFFLAKFTNRYVYYFVLQLLVVLPVYSALQRKEYRNCAWLGMLVYLTMFYSFSLNIMRQSIAIAIVIWAYRFIKDRKPVFFVAAVLIATGFHTSALFAFLLYVINIVTVYEPEGEKSLLRRSFAAYSMLFRVLIFAASVVLILFGSNFIGAMSDATGKFGRIVKDMQLTSGFDFINIGIMALLIFGLFMLLKNNRNPEMNYIFFVIILGTVIYQLKAISSQMYRLSMYFTMFLIYAVPYFASKTTLVKREKFLCEGLIILTLIGQYFYYIVFRGWHAVYPYASSFLGIY